MTTRNFLTSVVALTALIVSAQLFNGCAFLQKNPTGVQALAKNVAWVGTSEAINRNPAFRPAFVLAQQSLQTLLTSGKVDGAAINQILSNLPVPYLQSANGKIEIAAGVALIDLALGETIDISKAPTALSFATGLNDGLKAALGITTP